MALATRLDVNASIARQDLPMDIFNIAGEMFVYLNTCPQNYVKLDLRCYIVKLRIQGCRYWV